MSEPCRATGGRGGWPPPRRPFGAARGLTSGWAVVVAVSAGAGAWWAHPFPLGVAAAVALIAVMSRRPWLLAVGVLTALALLGFVIGVDSIGYGLTAVAILGAIINATSGVCLGCKIYLLARRLPRVRA